jgi:hypothetical protein
MTRTLAECAAAGLTLTEAAAELGLNHWTARSRARRAGVTFRDARPERMKALHADPEFAARRRERMKAMHAAFKLLRSKSDVSREDEG